MILIRTDEAKARAIVAKFSHIGRDVGPKIVATLRTMGPKVESRMRSNMNLSKRTGKLLRSFYNLVDVHGETILLVVGVRRRAFYASFQDLGITRREVEVKGHSKGRKGGDVKAGRRKIASGVGFVSAYRREMYLNPRPFIGITLEQMRAEINNALQLAVRGVVIGS